MKIKCFLLLLRCISLALSLSLPWNGRKWTEWQRMYKLEQNINGGTCACCTQFVLNFNSWLGTDKPNAAHRRVPEGAFSIWVRCTPYCYIYGVRIRAHPYRDLSAWHRSVPSVRVSGANRLDGTGGWRFFFRLNTIDLRLSSNAFPTVITISLC